MPTNSELFTTIENALDVTNLAANGQTADDNYLKSGLEALETLRQRVADLEAGLTVIGNGVNLQKHAEEIGVKATGVVSPSSLMYLIARKIMKMDKSNRD